MNYLARILVGAVAIALIWSARGAAIGAGSTAPAAACNLTFGSPRQVVISGTIGDVVIDDGCTHVYVTNTTLHRVEVYSLQTLSLEAPIPVGLLPVGLDVTPDGTLLYVANSGEPTVSVVNPALGVQLRKISVPPMPGNDTPYSVAIANNGLALISTTFAGSGFFPLRQLTLANDQVSHRTDVQNLSDEMRLAVSADRSTIGFTENSSAGPIWRYHAATNSFSGPKYLGEFVIDLSLDLTGSTIVATPGAYVLDAALTQAGQVVLESPPPALGGSGGSAIDPVTGLAYRAIASRLDVLNLSTFLKVGELPLSDSVSSSNTFNAVGRMAISGDGTLLAVVTNTGISLVRPTPPAPANSELMVNGAFGSGLTGWLTFATPDMSFVQAGIVAGVLEFFRVSPPAGTTNQAAVYQETGRSLPARAPLLATFDLGNSSSVRKRASVLVLDADFSDLHVCTFWLKPNQPLMTYRMQTHTTKPWTNAAIYFYAATEGSGGGAYRVDNVSLTYAPGLFNDWTDCVDPNAPVAPGGAQGGNLIQNPFFSPGLEPWKTFGTMTSRILSSFEGTVFEFTRPTDTLPAGVVLQPTFQPMNANEIVASFFSLGNSSTVRKRVTVLLHDFTFGDLAACTFWLEPQQQLQQYAMSTFATQPWSNATLSVYAATVGPESWTRLRGVTLSRFPSLPVTGTSCFEPASLVQGQFGYPVRRTAVAAASASVAAELAARAVNSAATAGVFGAPANVADSRVLGVLESIDLTNASEARLSFESLLPPTDNMLGTVEISTDGTNWTTWWLIGPSLDWREIEADMALWLGQRVSLRFVQHHMSSSQPADGLWFIRSVRVTVDGKDR